jgi:hypothetical protein
MAAYLRLYRMAGGDSGASLEALGGLEQSRRLIALRQQLRSTPVGLMAVALSEGGGLGLHFGMHEHFDEHPPSGPLDRELCRVTEMILEDERAHMLGRFRHSLELADDDTTWHELATHLTTICAQKLRERNQQFSEPLADTAIDALVVDRDFGRRYLTEHLGFLLEGI